MRTESRSPIWLGGLVMGLAVMMTHSLWAQDENRRNVIEASPLSQFSKSPGWSPNSVVLPNALEGEVLVTKEIDLGKTLRKYAALKKCTLNDAFGETVSYLKMVPLKDPSPADMVGAQAIYHVVKQDIYRISAPKKFFDALPQNLLCIENGKRHLSIQIYFLGLPADNPETFKSLMIPGSFVSFNNKIPQVEPYATSATYQDLSDSGGNHAARGTFVVASETRTKVYPTFLGRLDDENAKKLIQQVKADGKMQLTMSPRVTVMPGQTASISDAVTRPFVIGMNRFEGDFALAHQPVIQPIEDGTLLRLRGIGEDGQIRLDADLALSEIESVTTFAYSDAKRNGPDAGSENTETSISVQVPEQKLKQVHLSTLVKEGQTILIDPVFTRVIETPMQKRINRLADKPNETQKSRVLLMIKPAWVEAN